MRGMVMHARRGLGIAVLACLASAAFADVPDTLEVSARHELFYDSNLFRRSPNQPASTRSRSDTINTTTLGLQLDKSYSLQRFEVDANFVERRYRNFNYLDFSTLDYRGNWHWAATPWLRGNLIADRRTRPNSDADIADTSARNLRTEDELRLSGEANLGAAVRLFGAVGQERQTNEQLVVQDRDSKTRSSLAGLRYVFPSGSSIGYGVRLSQGEYLRQLADRGTGPTFEQTEHQVSGNWNVSGKTTLIGSLSYLKRTHQNVPFRDFSTPLGELQLRWTPTGKLRVDARLAQTYTVTHTDYASYSVGRRITLAPSWSATAHTTVRLQLEHFDQEFRGGRPEDSLLLDDRDDTVRLARLALDWRPREALLLTLQLQTERRSSSFANFTYRTHGASLAARLRF